MKRAMGFRIAIALAAALPLAAADVRAQFASDVVAAQWTAEELDNLLAPVALYPDPILAQVLVAASYPDEVELAAQHVRLYGHEHIDEQPWDISVKALAHYEPVLNLMADRVDWMIALGQAYADQPQDVMASVQSLRAMARAHGNLVTTAEQEVIVEDRSIRILPAQPRVVYVPVYDPLVVYHQPIVHLGVYRSGWSFGIGFPIGVWLSYDFDWRRRHVYYHGWDTYAYHSRWLHRSRPYIVVNNIYIHSRPTVVVVNRRVFDRRVDYDRFDRYNYVHRRVAWDRHRDREHRRTGGATGVPVRGNGPSWDRSGRVWTSGDGDRRAVPRGIAAQPRERASTTQPERSPRQWTQPERTQPEGRARVTEPPRTRPQQTEPQRARPRASEPQRMRPQSSQPPRTQPQRTQPERNRITSDPRVAQPERSRIRTSEPRVSQPERMRSSSSRQILTQPSRAEPQRARPRATTQPPRAPVQRAQPQRTSPPRAAPARSGGAGSQVRSAPPRRSGEPRARARANGTVRRSN